MMKPTSATHEPLTGEAPAVMVSKSPIYRKPWRWILLVSVLFVTSIWLWSAIYGSNNNPLKMTIFTDNGDTFSLEDMRQESEVEVEEEQYEEVEEEDYEESGEGEEYEEIEEIGEFVESWKGEEYEEGEEEEYYEDSSEEDENVEGDEGEEYEEEEEEEFELKYEGEGDDDNIDVTEAAMMEEDGNILEDEAEPQPYETPDQEENHIVERSVNQEIDFSIISGDKNWTKENTQPKIRFELRKQMMETRCQMADTSKEFYNIIKSNKFGVFFKQKASTCLVNKSGSTTWRSHLQRVNQASSIYQQKDKRWKAFMNQPNLELEVARTSKIITVRHPLTRLVSAYRQRFQNGKSLPLYIWNRRTQHVRKYFSNYWLPVIISNNIIPSAERVQLGMPVKHKVGKLYSPTMLKKVHTRLGNQFSITFPMFLRHVIYTHKENIVDSHWRPIQWLCSPCLIHYEYIVKLETMTDDVKYVFEKLNIPSNPEMQKNKERYVENPWFDLKQYADVPLDLKKEIIRLYWNDFYLFDYKLPPGFLDK